MRLVRWFLLVCILVACGAEPPAENMPDRAPFEKLVGESRTCQVDADCVIVGDGCAARCGVSVSRVRANEVAAAAQRLNRQYASLSGGVGTSCSALCNVQEPYCDNASCSVVVK